MIIIEDKKLHEMWLAIASHYTALKTESIQPDANKKEFKERLKTTQEIKLGIEYQLQKNQLETASK